MALNKYGQELTDPRPKNLIMKRPALTEDQRVQLLISRTLSKKAHQEGFETFEESQDFDVEDPFDWPEPETRYSQFTEEYLPQDSTESEPEKEATPPPETPHPTEGEGTEGRPGNNTEKPSPC